MSTNPLPTPSGSKSPLNRGSDATTLVRYPGTYGPLTGETKETSNYPKRPLSVDYDVADVRRRYLQLYTPLISDTMDHLGLVGRTFRPGIYPLIHTMKVAGPAFTVQSISTPVTDERVAKIGFTMIGSMTPGCVMVKSTQGDMSAGQFGEITATAMSAAGCVGAVIDGSTRDSPQLISMGFPTFVAFRHPMEAKGRIVSVDYQIPIYVKGLDGKLLINPGDYILGDNDGVVVVPKELTLEVLQLAEKAYGEEEKTRAAVASGMDPLEVFNKYGRF